MSLAWLFPTRKRLKALEEHLGVFYDKDHWGEYEDKESGMFNQFGRRVKRLEKKVLTDKERKDREFLYD